jgi:hypothetical protein
VPVSHTAVTGGEELVRALAISSLPNYNLFLGKPIDHTESVSYLLSMMALRNYLRLLCRIHMFFLYLSIRCLSTIIVERIVISAFGAEPVTFWGPITDELTMETFIQYRSSVIT